LPSTCMAWIVPPGAGTAGRVVAAGRARVAGPVGRAVVAADGAGGAGWAATETAQTLDSKHAANGRARLMRIKRLLPPLKRYCQPCAATARIGWLIGATIPPCLRGR
jgi:hypothetical protein